MLHSSDGASSYWRPRLVAGCLLATWGVLAARLIQIQWLDRTAFSARAVRQQTLVETIPARPGDIFDRAGRLLATTIESQSLYVDPSRVEDFDGAVLSVATALQLDGDRLGTRLAESRDRRFLWVKRRLADEEVAAIRALDLPADVWGFRSEYVRRYPQGTLAAHVIGLRDIDGVGHGGVEESFDSLLRGTPGRRELVRDAHGYVLEVLDSVEQLPHDGASVVLTIDSVIQLQAERRLDQVMQEWRPRAACAIVIDPRTGEILAMVSRPAFDPNNPQNVPAAAWSNTAIASQYEPGSTFKPFVIAWALEQGILSGNETFDCEQGEYRMGRRLLHDHHPYGVLNVTDILVKSSNIGMAKIGERMTNRGLYDASNVFGFGRRTGIELPGEQPGTLRPLEDWTSYSTGSVPMGQELSATPLQVIAAHAVLANGGSMMTPHLMRGLDGGGTPVRDVVTSRVVSVETARWLVETAMVDVVKRGTGQQAQLDDVAVFGKSGTAQKFDPETGEYSTEMHVSSFVCGAPAEHPQVLVLVSVDEPSVGTNHYGGTIAARPAADILREALSHFGAGVDFAGADALDPK